MMIKWLLDHQNMWEGLPTNWSQEWWDGKTEAGTTNWQRLRALGIAMTEAGLFSPKNNPKDRDNTAFDLVQDARRSRREGSAENANDQAVPRNPGEVPS